jgi:hypothetical protein
LQVPPRRRPKAGAPIPISAPPRPADPAELEAALDRVLAPGELIEMALPAVGSTLVLTDQRLLLVRQGASFRPRSGVRSWPIDRALMLQLGRPSHGSTRLIVARSGRSLSVFLTESQLAEAAALIAAIRRHTFATDELD